MKALCLLPCLAAFCLVSCSTPHAAQRPTVQVEIGEKLPLRVPKGDMNSGRLQHPMSIGVSNSDGLCTMEAVRPAFGETTPLFSVPTPSWVKRRFVGSFCTAERGEEHSSGRWAWGPGSSRELAVLIQNRREYYIFRDRGVVVEADGTIRHLRVLNPEELDLAVRRKMRWDDKEDDLRNTGTEKAMRQLHQHQTIMRASVPHVAAVAAPSGAGEKQQTAGDARRR